MKIAVATPLPQLLGANRQAIDALTGRGGDGIDQRAGGDRGARFANTRQASRRWRRCGFRSRTACRSSSSPARGSSGWRSSLGLVAAAAAAAVGAVRRLEGTERDAAAALAVALALWLVHALVDYDWDFVAVTGPAFSRPAPSPPRDGRRAAAVPVRGRCGGAIALAAAVRVATPLARAAERPRRQPGARARRRRRGARRRRAGSVARPALARAALRARPRRGGRRRRRGCARRLPARSGPPARQPGRLVRARTLRVQPRRPLLRLRPPNRAYTLDPAGHSGRPTASSSSRSPG